MTDRNLTEGLDAESLMDTIRQLSVVIGPRPPASRAERDAAAYVHETIRALNGPRELINQPLRTIDGFRYRIGPLALMTGLSLIAGLRPDRKSRFLGGLLSVGLSVLSRDAFLNRPMIWETWLPRGESQNVIVRIPPRHKAFRRVVFVAHLDSGVHRLTTDPRVVHHLPRTLGGVTLMALVGGVLTLLSGKNQRWRLLRTGIAASALGGAALAFVDEMGPDVAGANGNASGVAVLLGLARALRHHPLDSTEVILAFTGAATAVGTGADMLATRYGQEWANALWIVVNSVGRGELCWATRQGISPYAYYHPHPDAVDVMERVAGLRPALGLMGKRMLSMDEAAILDDRDLRMVTLMGYDRATGLTPNWRQSGDTIHEIDPATLERAAETVWAIATVVDQAETWPLNPANIAPEQNA